jgi:DUF1680 family protein
MNDCNRAFGLIPPRGGAVMFVLLLALTVSAAETAFLEKIPPMIPDRQDFLGPDHTHLTGWLGQRMQANEANRLVKLDPERLLEGYRKRPGRQSWDGEHVGKWLHAATLAWVNTGDPALRQKLDLVVSELMKCQLDDGYLGTYLDKDRWTEWDVWAHKYNLLGLLTYMRYTGNTEPLTTCRRMADLLCATFGDNPGQRDIIKAGHHVGMAPTSVLEPMVLLYRVTGESRYLDFCKYILRAWEQPNGPKIISTLLAAKRVDKVGNGKAYEMLSCLNGALEYYRTVGGRDILEACLNAWQDIVQNRLYLTGAASYGEHFHDDYDLPNVNNVGETCVTVTWLQFNAQLLRLTGEARFAEQLEHVILNQLLGAQRCDGSGWGYYVQMEGKKPYSSTLDGHCCLSSGPRGLALVPTFAVSADAEGVVVNLYDAGTTELPLRDGVKIRLGIETLYPADGKVRLQIDPPAARSFGLKLRVPASCPLATTSVNGKKVQAKTGPDGYLVINRKWTQRDLVELQFKLQPRVIVGDHKNEGKIALAYGPLVLAADNDLLPRERAAAKGLRLNDVAVASPVLASLDWQAATAPVSFRTWPGAQMFQINGVARRNTDTLKRGAPVRLGLVPFAEAGGTGNDYKVWLPLPGSSANGNVLLDGQESRSRPGNATGAINDEDAQSFVVTFDSKPATEDWFAVTLDEPRTIARVVFRHGRTFHDGGWFDASAGKPRVEIQTSKQGPWQNAAEFKKYPDTSATSPANLKGGEKFECQLASPAKVWAVRVLGKPACGDNPQQAFASCAELEAFEP